MKSAVLFLYYTSGQIYKCAQLSVGEYINGQNAVRKCQRANFGNNSIQLKNCNNVVYSILIQIYYGNVQENLIHECSPTHNACQQISINIILRICEPHQKKLPLNCQDFPRNSSLFSVKSFTQYANMRDSLCFGLRLLTFGFFGIFCFTIHVYCHFLDCLI